MNETETPKITQKSFDLLDGLAADNSKDWFDAHCDEVKASLQAPFAATLHAVSARLPGTDMELMGSADTMFRMNRDVRFSKDKRPYRESVAGLLTPSGAKKETDGVVYVELSPDGGWAGGGYYKLPTKALNVLRDRIVAKSDDRADTKAEIEARGGALVRDDSLTSMPRGYADHADGPLADELKLKSLLVRGDLPKSAWLDGTAPERIAATALAVAPLIAFGRAARG
ncbi:TIGR02453 family protein [Jannaschia aquimarina]|uniref:TIGR02453 family protein n=1 Tax=Jannaschia aquimarina TaxID=935700 RepID=A0A0D1DAT9_9RHOB|nr:DUF2461 domain-containing protein [Jannaschia aquimarina]KIT17058.1 hypothetical protein jaqu_12480 [Jannaschia aquimarina]SNS82476.1 TIGR02453 family protein [Jannaschia aquimarina]